MINTLLIDNYPENVSTDLFPAAAIQLESYENAIDSSFISVEIAEGLQGVIFSAKLKNYNNPVAIKKTSEYKEYGEREKAIYLKLGRHPNILKLYGFAEDNLNFYLFLELAQMNLNTYLINNLHDNRNPHECKHFAIGIAQALHYLHNKKILHRDLSADNVVIVKTDTSSEAKICDFGFSIDDSTPSALKRDMIGLSLIIYLLLTDDQSDKYGKISIHPSAYTHFLALQKLIDSDLNSQCSHSTTSAYLEAVQHKDAIFANKRKM